MERYQLTVLGLWVFAGSYAIHWLMYPFWQNKKLLAWLRIPLGVIAWLGVVGLLMPVKDLYVVVSAFLEHPTAGAAFEVGLFAMLFTGIAWVYQHGHVLNADRLRPFIRASLMFRHSGRLKTDVFALVEQQDLDSLALTSSEKQALHDALREKRVLMDREAIRRELDTIRRVRREEAGSEELRTLENGSPADITDLSRLFHFDSVPHPWFRHIVRMLVEPSQQVCEVRVSIDEHISRGLDEPKRWFRFRQDVFDAAHAMITQNWMERFLPYIATVRTECCREEEDAFGVTGQRAFLRVDIPVSVFQQYEGRIFVATELEKVGTITWLEE